MNEVTQDTLECVVEVGHFERHKKKQFVCGDTFLSTRIREENRSICVLSDGLGSGVKASVLSTLTSTMAANFTAGYHDIRKSAKIIMNTLPVCRERKISYATFTIIDIDGGGMARIIEYDNPACCIIRNGTFFQPEVTKIQGRARGKRPYILRYYTFPIQEGDRIICFSDGVTQSGIGIDRFPLGWGENNVAMFIQEALVKRPGMSARDLARQVVERSMLNDRNLALDDISCGVIYYRRPRELMIVSGPPFNPSNDSQMAAIYEKHTGHRIICGGTTAKIIARELEKTILLEPGLPFSNLPPTSSMEGATLVTEGIITLQRVADMLKSYTPADEVDMSPVRQIVELMLDSDIITFIAGTRINDAYQDPSLPQEIALRRSILREIVHYLENDYLKETRLKFI
ncbi:MAG: SpoIIE family protein phosphatase [Fibrobacter sp.]|nr:SpoIIE family protein phosphatase [Fibrobacter sp.]